VALFAHGCFTKGSSLGASSHNGSHVLDCLLNINKTFKKTKEK
jgi:hypothetical protein